ncbi:TVP38/TMEM64 family protein [Cohnella fermenti]|uniref:TVP38/TMEM64 family membrane protein n=1 Tax=Cohnella fermenti TaxID=2565925 RepID=A0A4S4BXY9_9BACL|nr:VTT domain-containing protein [Cohnella fermenti]THF79577.1 TVP38/TMEM64 family protein [Cohnella fermenti]
MGDYINNNVDWVLDTLGLSGFGIVLITLPLAVIQGSLGIFPFSTLIFLHISALGLVNGMLMSWLVSIVSSIVVYACCRYWFADWFERRMQRYTGRYSKWKRYFEEYGVWTIIVLRTIPIVPNNVISFLASVSGVKPGPYAISSLVGNLSHIGMFSIISSSILFPENDIGPLIAAYAAFCLILIGWFLMLKLRGRSRSEGT